MKGWYRKVTRGHFIGLIAVMAIFIMLSGGTAYALDNEDYSITDEAIYTQDEETTIITGETALGGFSALLEDTDLVTGETSLGGFSAILDDYYSSMATEESAVDTDTLSSSATDLILFNSKLAVAKVTDYVNIRASASTDADVVGRLYRAALATYVSIDNEWAYIESDDVKGYVSTKYLMFGDEAASFARDFYSNYMIVVSDTVNVRTGPGTDYGVISTITKGTYMKVLEKQGEWVKISLSGMNLVTSKEVGYVNSDYIDSTYRYALGLIDSSAIDSINATNINHMAWPLPSDHRICTYYGRRKAPCAGASTFHRGLDIGGAKGLSIVASLSGTVVASTWSSSGGYYIEIDHGNGIHTRYLHCSKLIAKYGQYVEQGETIALVGSTGISTSSHLHFSLILNGQSVDPYPYLKKVQ